MQVISIEYLKECLKYNHVNGKLLWLSRPESHFSSQRYMKAFNSQFSGLEAGTVRVKNGNPNAYKTISITACGRRRTVECHRVAFAMYHDYWPENIDHFDGCTINNSISNLRPATKSLNGRNRYLAKHNTSGIPGVSRNGNGWVVHGAGKPKLYIGRFSHIFEAACARKSYEVFNEYTSRHGEKRK